MNEFHGAFSKSNRMTDIFPPLRIRQWENSRESTPVSPHLSPGHESGLSEASTALQLALVDTEEDNKNSKMGLQLLAMGKRSVAAGIEWDFLLR